MVYADSDRPVPNSPPHKVYVVANFRQKEVKSRLLTRLSGLKACVAVTSSRLVQDYQSTNPSMGDFQRDADALRWDGVYKVLLRIYALDQKALNPQPRQPL